jgi:hypothetical protein
MLNYQLCTVASLLLIICTVITPIVRALTTSLRSIPGPFLARFTRLWELRAVYTHDFATYNIALHEEYGTVRPWSELLKSTHWARTYRQACAESI